MGISQAFGKAIADYTASLTNYIRLGSPSQYLTLQNRICPSKKNFS